ncbi:MAG: class D sortase [Parcubacteria group bacterium]
MPRITRVVLTFVTLFVVCGSAFFIIANWSAILEKLAWWLGNDRYKVAEVDGLGVNSEIIPPDDRLVIPKLAVNAPLLFPSSSEDARLLEELREGVVHYPGTALPGQPGNLFITGHSSQLAWEEGRYKDVFALLNRLEPGDSVLVYYQRTKYVYQVTGERKVDPSETSILDITEEPSLTLMTCWPVGTIARRLIVTGRLAEGTQTTSGPGELIPTTKPSTLPAAR